jgi:SAM-dependent methyltransferase
VISPSTSAAAAPIAIRRQAVAALARRFYPAAAASDPVAQFVRRLEQVVTPDDVVLDIGAGAGELNAYDLKGRVRHLVGVDVDRRVQGNPLLDAGVPADICALPLLDNSVDVAFSIYVLEHVEHPAALVGEIHRVLRPGGVCLFLTPNIFHYVTLVSRLSPLWFHRWINEKRGRHAADTFPTVYRLNSRRALTRAFVGAGFDAVSVDLIEVAPHYLSCSAVTYALGIAYERIVNLTEHLSGLRVNLIATFRKPPSPPGTRDGR